MSQPKTDSDKVDNTNMTDNQDKEQKDGIDALYGDEKNKNEENNKEKQKGGHGSSPPTPPQSPHDLNHPASPLTDSSGGKPSEPSEPSPLFLTILHIDKIIVWFPDDEGKVKEPGVIMNFGEILKNKSLFYHYAAARWATASDLSYQKWDDHTVIRIYAERIANQVKPGAVIIEYGPGESGKVLPLTERVDKSCHYLAVDMHHPFLQHTIDMINRQSERRTRMVQSEAGGKGKERAVEDLSDDEDVFKTQTDRQRCMQEVSAIMETVEAPERTEVEIDHQVMALAVAEAEVEEMERKKSEKPSEAPSIETIRLQGPREIDTRAEGSARPVFKTRETLEAETQARRTMVRPERREGITASGIQADFSTFPHVVASIDAPKLIVSFGSNLFNHPDPEAQLRPIATEMSIGDQIYLSIDCHDMRDARKVQATYTAPEFLAFLAATLHQVQGYRPEQWTLTSRLQGGDGRPGSADIRHSFCLTAREEVEIGGTRYRAGEEVEFFPCYKSSPETVDRVCHSLGMKVTDILTKEGSKMTHFLIEKVRETPERK